MLQSRFKLGELIATAISGNNIFSSSLYVSGIAIMYSGVYAPLVFLAVAGVLYFYKSVYVEVVEALPINGGVYNCLLNSTSKTIAALTGTITLLTYVATAVLSAKIAVEYLATILPIDPVPAAVALLAGVAVLVIRGLKDSAKLALIIFLLHVFTLVAFLVLTWVYFLQGHSFFSQNLNDSQTLLTSNEGLVNVFILGFAASLLGVSGFESSANFVEDQEPGVFRKTLRNMLLGVLILNPLLTLAVLNTAPMADIVASKEFLLAEQGQIIGGNLFQSIVVLDAFLVLMGAVLTSFISVNGLVYRMASDACLPGFLTKRNLGRSYPRIAFSFLLLAVLVLLVTGGQMMALAGLYTVSFLLVMALFALGNLILRETRTELKRTYRAPLLFVILALIATSIGLIGNVLIDPLNLYFFALYFIPAMIVVIGFVFQDHSISLMLLLTKPSPTLHRYLQKRFEHMQDGTLIAFINHVGRLHQILSYIERNETGHNIILVHCNLDEDQRLQRTQEIKEILPQLKKAGVFPYFNIKVVEKKENFGPKIVDEVSRQFKIGKNRIMIGSIHKSHPFDYSDLGGVRIIF